MPLEIIEEAEAFLRVARGETGDHWAREYGKMRGVEMMRWKEGEGKEKSEGFVSVEDGKSKYGVKLYDWDDYDY